MKRKTYLLYAARLCVNALIVVVAILMLLTPAAWLEGSTPLVLVLLAMAGCNAIIRYLWDIDRRINQRIYNMRKRVAIKALQEQEASIREEERRHQMWQQWFTEQKA